MDNDHFAEAGARAGRRRASLDRRDGRGENRELSAEEREKYDRVNDAITSFNAASTIVENVRSQAEPRGAVP
jgi:hypothetical protein